MTNQPTNTEVVKPNLGLAAAIAKAEETKMVTKGGVAPQVFLPKVPEGTFIGVVTDATIETNQRSKYGFNDRVKVTMSLFSEEGAEAIEWTVPFWKSSQENSLYSRHLSALLHRDVRKGFSLSELIGVTFQVSVVHNKVESGTYANIETIMPIEIATPDTIIM